MSKVWVIVSGAYEDRVVDGVAASLEIAVAFVKARYPAPYRVRWEGPIQVGGAVWTLDGHFERVFGKSRKHSREFEFTEWDVDEAAELAARRSA